MDGGGLGAVGGEEKEDGASPVPTPHSFKCLFLFSVSFSYVL